MSIHDAKASEPVDPMTCPFCCTQDECSNQCQMIRLHENPLYPGESSELHDCGLHGYVLADSDNEDEEFVPTAFMTYTKPPPGSPGRVPAPPDSDEELLEDANDVSQVPNFDKVFSFGQHKGSTYGEILFKYPAYFTWGLKQTSPGKFLVDYLDWVSTYFVF